MGRRHLRCHHQFVKEFFVNDVRNISNITASVRDKNVIVTDVAFEATDSTFSLLRHPPKFIPTPVKCCHQGILSGVLDLLRKYKWCFVFFSNQRNTCRFNSRSSRHPPHNLIPKYVHDNCRAVTSAVRSLLSRCRACYSGSNLTQEERDELNRLSVDESVVVTPVDKGSSWMIIPKSDYQSEAFRQLNDSTFYKRLCEDNNINKFTGQRLDNLLQFLYKKGFLSKRELLALKPPESPQERLFYLLPKIHKTDWFFPAMPPGRPIVSDVGSVSRGCADLVEYFLAPLAKHASSYVRDSLHVISLLSNFPISDNSVFVTMDVRSLYTNIPTNAGIAAVSRAFLKYPDPRRPDLTILTILRILLTSNVFRFNGNSFLQTHGTAMGCAFGASYANIFLSEWDDRISQFPNAPVLWLRFIDDVLALWDHGVDNLRSFHNDVNSLFPTIKVDLNFSRDCIRFLDIELYRKDNKISHRVAFKPTDSHFILTPTSYHRPHVFKGILFGEVYRWVVRSSTYEDFKQTKREVQPVWRRLGYSRSAIRQAVRKVLSLTLQTPTDWETGFTPCNDNCTVCGHGFHATSLVDNVNRNSYAIVHRLTCDTFNVIYLIACTNCRIRYVGQTSQHLRLRMAQHLSDIRRASPTAIATHFTTVCSITDFSFTALEHCPDPRKRLLKENRWIRRLGTLAPSGLNRESNHESVLRLVIPQSDCGDKAIRLCQQRLRDVTVTASFTTHRNLRSILRCANK